MSSFNFPPPPPPPPPAAVPVEQSHKYEENSSRGGRGGGRWLNRGRGRGRSNDSRGGRGGGHFRGMNNSSHRPSAPDRVSYGAFSGSERHHNLQSPTNGAPSNSYRSGSTSTSNSITPQPVANVLPQMQQSYPTQQAHQAALSQLTAALPQYNQLLSAISTVSQTQYTQEAPGLAQNPPPSLPSPFPNQNHSFAPNTSELNFLSSYPVNDSHGTPASAKRKRRDAPRWVEQSSQSQDMPKPETTPAVPSFGFTLPQPVVKPPVPSHQDKAKKKRTFNQLGLTPRGEDHESSEEEVDEEAVFATTGGPLTFMHRGQASSLKSKAEIEAWVAQRRANYPTKARIEERKRQEALRLAERQANRRQIQNEETNRGQGKHMQQKANRAQQKADKLREKLMKLEAKAARAAAHAETSNRKSLITSHHNGSISEKSLESDAQITNDSAEHGIGDGQLNDSAPAKLAVDAPAVTNSLASLGLNYESSSGNDRPSALSSSDEISSDSEDDDSSSLEDSDSDSAPEEESILKHQPEKVLPPQRVAKNSGYCNFWLRNGRCKRGRSCRFKHEYPTDWKGPRKATEQTKPKPVVRRARLYEKVRYVLFFRSNSLTLVTACSTGTGRARSRSTGSNQISRF